MHVPNENMVSVAGPRSKEATTPQVDARFRTKRLSVLLLCDDSRENPNTILDHISALKGERIRLHGIDCPEKRQAFGNRAKQFTSTLVFGTTVTVQVVDRDRYGRTVGEVLLPDGRSGSLVPDASVLR